MKFTISATSDSLKKYETVLKRFKYSKGTIEIDSLQGLNDFMIALKELAKDKPYGYGTGLVLTAVSDVEAFHIEIYDDYRE